MYLNCLVLSRHYSFQITRQLRNQKYKHWRKKEIKTKTLGRTGVLFGELFGILTDGDIDTILWRRFECNGLGGHIDFFVYANANKKRGANSDETTANDWYNQGLKQFNSRNYNAALGSFLKSTESNHAKAQYSIGVLYQKGYGVEVEFYTSLSWYLEAAENGHLNAQYNIGVLYDYGGVFTVNYNVALFWYLQAAKQGHLPAQYNIGVLYQNGHGVRVNYNVALSWYLKAEKQEYLSAQNSIGVLYDHGNGVDVALSWYLKAAKQGHLDAKKFFATLYGDINGVEQDYNVALESYEKALENGYEPTRVNIDQVNTKKLESQLLPVNIDAETEPEPELELTKLKREAEEAKEQIAKLNSEIEKFKNLKDMRMQMYRKLYLFLLQE
ncbi:hypothetical protein EDC94DRAFT_644793 [Helicostylum pulchrum]|nr:hypothetical protein EDC94DRAFT_644793 [Helicostylum pulchrum]